MLGIVLLIVITLSVYFLRRSKKYKFQRKDAIFITGCDTGIGYSLACYCQEMGMTVLAGCFKFGDGALLLSELKNVFVVQLNVMESKSIANAAKWMANVLNENEGMTLKAVVNNAGVMVFGEFTWQTEILIQQQIQTNLNGPMNITNAFLPQIIDNKGRIINICSHCSLESLPGLSVYSASKAGLLAWGNALRVELKKFNVPVVSLIPGSYFLTTNILSNQKHFAYEMERCMSERQKDFYKSYFQEYNSYLSGFSPQAKLCRIRDRSFYRMFDDALRLEKPNALYCYSPWRYWIYHQLFKITPTSIRDKLVVSFVNMPSWKKSE